MLKLNKTTVEDAIAKAIDAGKAARHCFGHKLYLDIHLNGSVAWLFRYRFAGHPRAMGLGPYPEVDVAMAEEEAFRLCKIVRQGRDPKTERDERGPDWTFDDLVAAFAAAKNPDSYTRGLLARHCHCIYLLPASKQAAAKKTAKAPVLNKLPVEAVSVDDVKRVLVPMWTETHPTAKRVQERLEAVFDYAKSQKKRTADNPATLDALNLPVGETVHRETNTPSMPYALVPAFMTWLRTVDKLAARGLEFMILTGGGRSGHIFGKPATDRKQELPPLTFETDIDFDDKVWRAHVTDERKTQLDVPLTDEALDCIRRAQALGATSFQMGKNEMGKLLDKWTAANMADVEPSKRPSPHGFRSTFRTWGENETTFDERILEACISHTIGGTKTQKAYNRGDVFWKRGEVLDVWSRYACGTLDDDETVVPFLVRRQRKDAAKAASAAAPDRVASAG